MNDRQHNRDKDRDRNKDLEDDDEDVEGNEDEFLAEGQVSPADVEDVVKAMFQRDLEDAWELDQRTAQQSHQERTNARIQFVRDRFQHWSSITRHGERNFLHFLASNEYSSKFRLQWLMARAISKLPKLMGVLDGSKRTPLTVAISARNNMFVYAACKNVKDEKKDMIRTALMSECEEREVEGGLTCLHAALLCGLRPELTQAIIKFAPEEMFQVTDLRGRTPLHLAVEYDRCNAEQVGIVEELLARGPNALKKKMSAAYGRCSAFQYHERTRREKEEKNRRTAEDRERMKPPALPAKVLESDGRRDDRADGDARKNEKAELRKGDKPSRDPTSEPLGFVSGFSTTRRDSISAVAVTPPTGRERPRTLGPLETVLGTAKAQISPTTARPPDRDKTNEEADKERKASSDKIREQLKLEYLRIMPPQEAMQCLHIQDQKDKELWFDFGPKPHSKINEADFRKQFGHLDFDKVLQYVAFPRIELDDPRNYDPDDRYSGRQDMKFFFNWLKSKGVERILRVEVDDMEMPCHSDQAIEEALEPFGVEVLDWKRLDLDPLSIHRIGDKLREIQLCWSGSNAVLRSWSEKEGGLCLTPTLRKITMTQDTGLESTSRTSQNLDAFHKRLLESWKTETKPEFIPPKSAGGRIRRSGQPVEGLFVMKKQERHVDPHKWMQCMEEFASHFRQIRELSKRRSDSSFNPVTVALIDDGTDITHPELRGLDNKNFAGKSFDYYRDGWWRVSPYWDSTSGHGTLMARLIHRVCPSAVIYVIKLKTMPTANSTKVQIEPKSAIQAIEHATEIGAQIISMSWTTREPENATDKTAFDEAIRNANTKGILMFCSASDQGKFQDFNYPCASNPNYTFRIGAAKATGTTSEFVGDDKDLNFVFPGQEVVLSPLYEDVSDKEFNTFASHTGSSVATALAAGLAALVYECVRLGMIHTIETKRATALGAIRREDLMSIRSKQRMEEVLLGVGVNLQTGNKYLEVWKRFDDPARKLKESDGMKELQLEVVAGLARLLLNKIN